MITWRKHVIFQDCHQVEMGACACYLNIEVVIITWKINTPVSIETLCSILIPSMYIRLGKNDFFSKQ